MTPAQREILFSIKQKHEVNRSQKELEKRWKELQPLILKELMEQEGKLKKKVEENIEKMKKGFEDRKGKKMEDVDSEDESEDCNVYVLVAAIKGAEMKLEQLEKEYVEKLGKVVEMGKKKLFASKIDKNTPWDPEEVVQGIVRCELQKIVAEAENKCDKKVGTILRHVEGNDRGLLSISGDRSDTQSIGTSALLLSMLLLLSVAVPIDCVSERSPEILSKPRSLPSTCLKIVPTFLSHLFSASATIFCNSHESISSDFLLTLS
jgi:hypothetical protein